MIIKTQIHNLNLDKNTSVLDLSSRKNYKIHIHLKININKLNLNK